KFTSAVNFLSNNNRDWEDWNRIIMAIYAATNGSSIGLGLAHTFSVKASKYDAEATDDKWDALHDCPPNGIGAGTIYYEAAKEGWRWEEDYKPGSPEDGGHHARMDEGVSLEDFYAYMPQHNYIYVPSREPWPAASVNARIPPVPILDANRQPMLDEN